MRNRRSTILVLAAWLALLAGCGRVSTSVTEEGAFEPVGVVTQELPWVVNEIDATRETTGQLAIAVDGSGAPHIAYYADKLGEFGYGVRYAFIDGDGVWQTEPIGDATSFAAASIALDGDGVLHALYLDRNISLVYVTRANGTWSVPEVVATSSAAPSGPLSLMLDDAGTPHVGFNTGAELMYAVPSGAGGWNLSTVASSAQAGRLALDHLGQPHAVYADAHVPPYPPTFALKYAYRDGAGAWVSETIDSGGQTGQRASLTFDGADHPHVGYVTSSGAVKYAVRGSDGWSTPQYLETALLGVPSIAVDGSGNPHIAYIGGNDANQYALKYASYADGWTIEAVDVVGYGSADIVVALALDGGNRPHIAYPDSIRLKYATWIEPVTDYVVTNGNDAGDGSLRQAILDAPAGATITFASDVTEVVLGASSGSLALTKDVTIAGPAEGTVTVRGDGTFRIFDIRTGGVAVVLRNLTIRDGRAPTDEGVGGGIAVLWTDQTMSPPSLHLDRCTVTGNHADAGGGVVSSGNLLIERSTLAGNSAAVVGGGIYFVGTNVDDASVPYPVRATILDSTITGNAAESDGGGLFVFNGALRMLFSTVTANTAGVYGGGIVSYNDANTRTTVKGSIVVGNLSHYGYDDLNGVSTGNLYDSQGYNVVGFGSGYVDFATEFVAVGDVQWMTVEGIGLQPLAANGGPTLTHSLSSTSAVLDAVPPDDCTDLTGAAITTDQRGITRPQGWACDPGAFEVEGGALMYRLSVTVEPSLAGSVDGDGTYQPGATAKLTATPAAHWTFSHWSGDLTGTDNPATLAMDASKTVVANFTPVLYPVTETLDGGGSVVRVPDAAAYPYGTTVTVTAVPTDEWHFVEWTGVVTGSSLSASFEVTGEMAYAAHFTQWYLLNTGIVGEGGVTRDPSGEYFQPGATVTLTATPMAGWRFDHWSGDLAGSPNPASITMDAAKTVTATFVPDTYTVSATVVGDGSVDGAGTYAAGTMVTLTPTPDAGSYFVGWTGDVVSTNDPLVLILKSDLAITATFAPLTYTVDTTTEGGGRVDLDPATGPYVYGTLVALTPTADAGWHFDHWSGDLEGSDVPGLLTMDANKAVTATFVQDALTHLVTTHADGPGTVLGGGTYADGATATLSAVADPGALFDHWSGDASGSTNPLALTVRANLDVTAHFVLAHTLDVTIQGAGEVTTDPPVGPFADGTVVTLTATPAPGWLFDAWTGSVTGSANPTTIEMRQDEAVTAIFVRVPVPDPTVSVVLDGDGRVWSEPEGIDCVPDGAGCLASFPAKTRVTLHAVPGPGTVFVGWTGAVTDAAPDLTIRLRDDLQLTAHFLALTGPVVLIDPTASFHGNTAIVTGSLVCATGNHDLEVAILQEVPVKKAGPLLVSASTRVIGAACGQPWTATLVAESERFVRGEAKVTVLLNGVPTIATVQLR